MALIIRSSAIHAAGCYSTTAVRKGTRLAEYTGPRLSKDEADAANEDSPITYLFGLGDGTVVIDGHCMAMFINHSCNPNCETEEIRGRVWIKAIRKIRRAKKSPMTTASTTVVMIRQHATAEPKSVAAPCTRARRFAVGRPPRRRPARKRPPSVAPAPRPFRFLEGPRLSKRKTPLEAPASGMPIH